VGEPQGYPSPTSVAPKKEFTPLQLHKPVISLALFLAAGFLLRNNDMGSHWCKNNPRRSNDLGPQYKNDLRCNIALGSHQCKYDLRREEHLWNISVLQRVQISSLVMIKKSRTVL
jgi:hypothetical protein